MGLRGSLASGEALVEAPLVVEVGGPECEAAGLVRGHVPEELAALRVRGVADGGADAVALVQQLHDAPPERTAERGRGCERSGGAEQSGG